MGVGEGGRRLDWIVGVIAAAAVVGTVQGRRIAHRVEDVSFGALLVLIVLFVCMAWWRVRRGWKDRGVARWRVWFSVAGCVALSFGFGLPCIQQFFGFRPWFGSDWNYKTLMIGFGMAGLISGIFGVKRVGFALIFGGLLIALVGIILPVPIL